jgi:phosphoserine phosphatase RsbU/P
MVSFAFANLHTSASIADQKAHSVIGVPRLAPDGQASGSKPLSAREDKQILEDDRDVPADVAGQMAASLRNASLHETLLEYERLARDLKSAEEVQHQLLPQSLPKLPGYAFFAYYRAAHEVGGDYYDFVALPENRLGIALGDVSGKGVAAALIMAKFSGDARLNLRTEGSAAAAARVLNTALCKTGIDDRFITLSLLVLEASTGRLQLCSAGHPPVLLRRADGTVEELGKNVGGFPLGIVPDTAYQQVNVELRPGDVAVVYSDGVTDSRNPTENLYDTQDNRRLLKCIEGAAGGPEAVGEAILQEIHEFSRGHVQADDITLVSFGPSGR